MPHVDPDEETSTAHSINVLEHGSFSIVHGARTFVVGPSEVFVTVPGQVHRYLHDDREDAPGDSCIAISFNDASHDGIDERMRSACRVAPANNRRAYLRHRLMAHVAGPQDRMALDLIAGELLDAVGDTRPTRLFRAGQLTWYARRIDAARRALDADFSGAHTLSALAADAGMSPFHFARVFRELTGTPPHRYLLRRRLIAAATMLRDGASVTDTCFAVGFESLSHFIHAFRRTFGVPPSRLTTAARDTTPS